MKKTTWIVKEEGDSKMLLINDQNASCYIYSRTTKAAFLSDPLTVAARKRRMHGYDEMIKNTVGVWCLTCRKQNGKLRGMREYTVGPDAEQLRLQIIDEANYLAGYLTRSGISSAQDGPHLAAQEERYAIARVDSIGRP